MNRVQEINFTPKAKRVLDVAKQACIEKKIAEISDDFLFYAVLKSDSMIVNSAFAEIKISPQELAELVWKALPSIVKGAAKENVEFTTVASKIINESLTYSKQYNQKKCPDRIMYPTSTQVKYFRILNKASRVLSVESKPRERSIDI